MCVHDVPLRLATHAVRRYLFAVTQYCRAVSDLTDEDKKAPTPFHSTEEPLICLGDYAMGLRRRFGFCNFTVLLALVYMGRMAQRTGRCPSIMSVHRLFASSLLYASRVLHGDHFNEVSFAQHAGFAPSEIDRQLQLVDQALGHDVGDYAADVRLMYYHLEAASFVTLRSEITQIVAEAFGVAPPGQGDVELDEDAPTTSLASFRSIPAFDASPSAVASSTPNSSISHWQSTHSNDSHLVMGSGVTAARRLRGAASPQSAVTPGAPCWPLLLFSPRYPQRS